MWALTVVMWAMGLCVDNDSCHVCDDCNVGDDLLCGLSVAVWVITVAMCVLSVAM